MTRIIMLAAGGALGTLLRYSLSGYTYRVFGGVFPYGTLVVNLAGSFAIGLLWGMFEGGNLSPNLRNFIFIGMLGGFTTFSTFALESFHLFRDGELRLALSNILVSNVAGVLFVFAGLILAKSIVNFMR